MRRGAAGVWVGKQLLKATHTRTSWMRQRRTMKRSVSRPDQQRGAGFMWPLARSSLSTQISMKYSTAAFLERQEYVQISATNEQMLSFSLP